MTDRVVLPPCNRGRNKRGIAAHKATKGAKAAKRQSIPGLPKPVTAYKMRADRT